MRGKAQYLNLLLLLLAAAVGGEETEGRGQERGGLMQPNAGVGLLRLVLLPLDEEACCLFKTALGIRSKKQNYWKGDMR